MTTEVIPKAYFLWYSNAGKVDDEYDPGRVDLLHTVSQLPTRIGHPPTQWDNHAFYSKGGVVAGTIAVKYWDEIYTHQICVAQYVSKAV